MVGRLSGAAAFDPLVDFFFLEFPEAAYLVGRHVLFAYPPVNGIPLDAKINRNIVYGEPSIFHQSSPLTLSIIGCFAADSYYRFMDRLVMDQTQIYWPFIQTNWDKQG